MTSVNEIYNDLSSVNEQYNKWKIRKALKLNEEIELSQFYQSQEDESDFVNIDHFRDVHNKQFKN